MKTQIAAKLNNVRVTAKDVRQTRKDRREIKRITTMMLAAELKKFEDELAPAK